MSDLCFEDRVASWSTLGLVEERNNVLTIYTHPRRISWVVYPLFLKGGRLFTLSFAGGRQISG